MSDLVDQALVTLEEARRYVFRNENDGSRDDLLVDSINVASPAIWDYCEREFKRTTVSDRSGTDGVGNGSTTFVAASGAFVDADIGALLHLEGQGDYRIVSRTNATTVVLDAVVAVGTALSWDFGEARVFDVDDGGRVNFEPFDLRVLGSATLYPDLDSGSQDLLGVTEYRLRPTNGTPSGTFLYMHTIAPTINGLETQFGHQVSIRGDWGMAEVPGGVKMACLQWVENLVKNPGSFLSQTMNGYSVIPDSDSAAFAPAGMPAAVRYRLERWRRGVWVR